MGIKWRKDSVAALRQKKSMAQLQEENEQLMADVSNLETQLTSTQLALCDVYEQLLTVSSLTGGDANG